MALLLILCLAVSGCRTRTGIPGQADPGETEVRTENVYASGSRPGEDPDSPDVPEDSLEQDGSQAAPDKTGKADSGAEDPAGDGEPGGRTRENPEASRREYDESRPAEILPGSERTVHGAGEGPGYSGSGEESDRSAAKLNEDAEKTAKQTVPAEEAEQKGVSEDAAEADSAMTYYSVLLQDRMGSLFECQRKNVYWETKEDHVTVFKTSPEHALILNAGAYDVSARLLEANLHVDDGWIGRKNPEVIVKVVDRSVLGTGAGSAGAARSVYAGLLSREGWSGMEAVRNGRVLLLSEELLEAPHLQLAAMLILAKTANPELFADLDADRALEMLSEEATGTVPAGIFCYSGQGGPD